jgi:3-methyl-2-oxobutanoate hydroxymethyltransferase
MECVPDAIAADVTRQLSVPTIGIGAGPHCDGQVLVTNDLLGWNSGYLPKFVRQYAQLRQAAIDAVTQFKNDLQNHHFPGPTETFQE